MVWHDLKKAIHARKPSSVAVLQLFCKDKWAKIPPQLCKRLIASYRKCLIAFAAAKGGPTSYSSSSSSSFRFDWQLAISLQAYLSILYLKPRTQIILRGKKVVAKLMSKKLTYIEHDVYKPQFSKEKVRVTFGFNAKNREHYGIMMYHKNRLIKAYEKVGWQLKASGQRAGTGVIGIIECNFLKPAHNKQDFEYTKEYRLTLGALGLKLNDYWKEVTDKRAKEREFQALDRDEDQDGVDEGPMWLQCEECLKWRSIPAGHYKVAPESWNCSQNPNARYRTCSSPEEGEEEVLLTPTYQKNHKKPEHVKNKKRERSSESSVVLEFKEKAAKHEVSLQRSSEPVKPTSRWSPEHTTTKDQHRDVEETFEHDTNTDHLAGYQGKDNSSTQSRTKESSTGRNTIIKNKNEVPPGQSVTEDETSNLDLQDEDCDQRTNILSLKRKNQSLISCDKKKRLLSEEQQPESGNKTEETQPGKQKNIFKSLSTKDNKNDSSSRVDNLDTNAQQAHTGHTWSHPVPFTQTVVVSPLSWTEGPQSRTLPPEGGSREATMQRLAGLEKEAERLRSLLGLEIAKTTQDAVTVTDNSLEKPKKRQVNSSNCKETSCQTDIAECSASSSGPTGVAQSLGLAFQGQKALSEANSQPELSRTRKERTESQSKMRVGDTETEDRRSVQDSLRGIRSNVVALLTALLPQLDLTGISLETADVDNILQQIIEVNSLKL
ncbi:uncharacterized protein KZ484_009348 isoform 2-T2 [Pholidichthys leucotaenia]